MRHASATQPADTMQRQGAPGAAPRRLRRRLVATGAALGMLAVTAATQAALTPSALAATNPFQRGADPTVASIAANTGPFKTTSVEVKAGVGFKSGMIYYPTDTTQGTWGAVVIVPGFTALFANEEAWMGPKLASYGFVVLGIETNDRQDSAALRGTEALAALDYLTKQSVVANMVDPDRLAVMGHSAGGAGVLSAAMQRTSLKATIGLAPGGGTNDLSKMTVPTMIVAGEKDRPGPLLDLYNTVPTTTKKAYVAISGADHLYFTKNNTIEMRSLVPWLKITVDADTRYTPFMCPTMQDTTSLLKYAATCPLL